MAAVERLEALQDAEDDEGVVLVAHGEQVPVRLHVDGLAVRAVRVGHVNADGVAREALDDLVQLQVLEGEDAQVAVVAGRDDPVLLAVGAHAQGHQVVDLAAVEAKDHVRVDSKEEGRRDSESESVSGSGSKRFASKWSLSQKSNQ